MSAKGPSIQGVIAIIIGNMLEWFDFGIFAFMTPIISGVFSRWIRRFRGAKSIRSSRPRRFLAPGSSCAPSAPLCWASTGTGKAGKRR